ncbi:mRNA surveillance protein pelota [Halobacteriales archaeon QS_8_69_26]|nr:MAG: mRNA surveillance protein pelota [Halobacteriales archaeon QS_8_69_26]
MRIQSRERRDDGTERITLVPESVDDLWHLQYVVEPGDRVGGDTHRRVTRDDDRLRDTGGEREHMYATLEVEDVEFHRFANRLRISGVIVDCSREDQLGHHHTLNVEVRKEVTVTKRFKPDQLERLQEAVEAAENPDVAIATVEEGQAHVHTVAQHGTEEYASITGTTGKGEYARPRSELFAELLSTLQHLEVDAIVLAGPGFTKNDALDYIEENDRDLAAKITIVDTASVGDRGVHEALKRGAVDEIQEETRIAREAELIDELTAGIAGDGAVAYGPDRVRQAADYGAVEHLLVVDEWLRESRLDGSDRADAGDDADGADESGSDEDEGRNGRERITPEEFRAEREAESGGSGDGGLTAEEEAIGEGSSGGGSAGSGSSGGEGDGTAEADAEPAVDPDDLIRTVEQQGGDVTVFSKEFDPGRQLSNLGGVAALLRYPID